MDKNTGFNTQHSKPFLKTEKQVEDFDISLKQTTQTDDKHRLNTTNH